MPRPCQNQRVLLVTLTARESPPHVRRQSRPPRSADTPVARDHHRLARQPALRHAAAGVEVGVLQLVHLRHRPLAPQPAWHGAMRRRRVRRSSGQGKHEPQRTQFRDKHPAPNHAPPSCFTHRGMLAQERCEVVIVGSGRRSSATMPKPIRGMSKNARASPPTGNTALAHPVPSADGSCIHRVPVSRIPCRGAVPQPARYRRARRGDRTRPDPAGRRRNLDAAAAEARQDCESQDHPRCGHLVRPLPDAAPAAR